MTDIICRLNTEKGCFPVIKPDNSLITGDAGTRIIWGKSNIQKTTEHKPKPKRLRICFCGSSGNKHYVANSRLLNPEKPVFARLFGIFLCRDYSGGYKMATGPIFEVSSEYRHFVRFFLKNSYSSMNSSNCPASSACLFG